MTKALVGEKWEWLRKKTKQTHKKTNGWVRGSHRLQLNGHGDYGRREIHLGKAEGKGRRNDFKCRMITKRETNWEGWGRKIFPLHTFLPTK